MTYAQYALAAVLLACAVVAVAGLSLLYGLALLADGVIYLILKCFDQLEQEKLK